MPTATLSKSNAAHLLIITYLKEVQGRRKHREEKSTTMQVKIYS